MGAAAVRFSINLFFACLILAATMFVGGHAFPVVSQALGFPHRSVAEVFTGPQRPQFVAPPTPVRVPPTPRPVR
jgi:hypothetical protein